MVTPMKVLFFDIETAPMSGWMWRPKTEYVPHGQRIDEMFMLTWAAKWQGSKRMYSDYVTPTFARTRDDSAIVGSLAALVREADIVVAHNGRRFDVPRLNGRLLVLGLEPLPPFRVIDTLELARKSFDLPYNRLDYLGQVLLGEGKIDTDFDLWRNVMAGDERAMRYMVRYNRKDVNLLERVFDRILPYARGVPRMVRAERDGEFACPHCGSTDLEKRGFHDTNASSFQVYHCNKCGHWPRERINDRKRLRLVPTNH